MYPSFLFKTVSRDSPMYDFLTTHDDARHNGFITRLDRTPASRKRFGSILMVFTIGSHKYISQVTLLPLLGSECFAGHWSGRLVLPLYPEYPRIPTPSFHAACLGSLSRRLARHSQFSHSQNYPPPISHWRVLPEVSHRVPGNGNRVTPLSGVYQIWKLASTLVRTAGS